MRKIVDVIRQTIKTLRDFIDFKASNDRIYHYTSAFVAMENILSKNSLRFNSLRKTNDPREFEYWATLVTSHPQDEREVVERLVAIAPELVDNIKSICKIACFTVDRDSSNSTYLDIFDKGYCFPRMWSQYADNHRGICLVFSLDKLLNHIPVDIKTNHFLDNESINIYPGRVRYDNDIRKLDDALTIDVSNDKGKTDEQLMGERIDVLLFNKYKDYEHENEFRIALFSKKFTFMDTIDIGFGNALEGIILGTRFKNVYAPTILKLASELDVPILKLNWMNGIPDLEEYTMH